MVGDKLDREDHEKFKELSALAGCGGLTPREWFELKSHLDKCEECSEISLQYRILATQGIPTIAAVYTERQEQGSWDDRATWKKLVARVRTGYRPVLERNEQVPVAAQPYVRGRIAASLFAGAALAACLVVTVGFGAYRLGVRAHDSASPASMSPDDRLQTLAAEKKSVDALLAAQAEKLTQLREESSQQERELAKLRSALRAMGDHSNELMAANTQSEGQLKEISKQRDTLNAQLQDANQIYQNVRAEFVSLKAERDRALLRTTALEAKIDELTVTNQDQERRLKDTEQYLASDRDIRELMGARKLYIADVFDVDSGSSTRKPFGRVFYTQGKSLIFYAFDLDRQPGVVNANTFQVWGQKETAQGQQALPMNLGILYMDNESNRRWVMRFDRPKQLTEIDAVFVTVEPRGGSRKPTSKPFLYALLRNEVNHP